MDTQHEPSNAKWARFRFSVVGALLASPPERGMLRRELDALAEKLWEHPIAGIPTRFGRSTIERWYYTARRGGADPVGALRRKRRRDAGERASVGAELRPLIHTQYQAHRRWSVKLHYDNLGACVRSTPALGPLPSYATIGRFMREAGLRRAKGRRTPHTAGAEAAVKRFETREVRSYEATHVGALYHTDFHESSRAILGPEGTWKRPVLYGCLDDRSRLACHLQWYWQESAQTLAHGTVQAFLKRGLPRSMMSDRGAAQTSQEFRQGLEGTGVVHALTLPYSPYQNAKQEVFWASVEGRLLAMLEGVEDLTLDLLNEATQAWVSMDYNREVHRELGTSPLDAWRAGPSVLRESPDPQVLREAFRRTVPRRVRRSDATVSIESQRYDVPSRYANLDRAGVRYAKWDLGTVHLVDLRTGETLCRIWPQDLARNAQGVRALRQGPAPSQPGTPLGPPAPGMAPLLREHLDAYAREGAVAAYLPLHGEEKNG